MSNLIFWAAFLIVLLGVIHSALGEFLIFRHLRKDGRWIQTGVNGLRTRQIRALWSTWHLVSLLGFCLAGILMVYSVFDETNDLKFKTFRIISYTFFAASLFWLLGTQRQTSSLDRFSNHWIFGLVYLMVVCPPEVSKDRSRRRALACQHPT